MDARQIARTALAESFGDLDRRDRLDALAARDGKTRDLSAAL